MRLIASTVPVDVQPAVDEGGHALKMGVEPSAPNPGVAAKVGPPARLQLTRCQRPVMRANVVNDTSPRLLCSRCRSANSLGRVALEFADHLSSEEAGVSARFDGSATCCRARVSTGYTRSGL